MDASEKDSASQVVALSPPGRPPVAEIPAADLKSLYDSRPQAKMLLTRRAGLPRLRANATSQLVLQREAASGVVSVATHCGLPSVLAL
jgi:hypothetical protein